MVILGYIFIGILLCTAIIGNELISEVVLLSISINDSEPYFNTFLFAVIMYLLGFLVSLLFSYVIFVLVYKVCENML